MEKEEEKESIQFWLPAELKRKAEKRASDNYMSLTKYLIMLIRRQK